MKIIFAFALVSSLYFVTHVDAESSCLECFKATQEELTRCLDNAISQEDKISCEDKQQDQAKICENGECKLERDERDKSIEIPQERK